MSSSLISLDDRVRLSSSVALRPEPFGALAYHFGNRRLTFLKRPELLSLVQSFDGHRSMRECLSDAEIPEGQWGAYLAALTSLLESQMLELESGNAA
jgi:putative mycofactocin binding protein MftB